MPVAPSTKDRKGQNEEGEKAGTVESTCDEVTVLLEDARVVVPQIILHEETGNDPAEDDTRLGLVVREVP